jgi:hypothetical protein
MVRARLARHLEATLARRRSARQLGTALAEAVTRRDVASLTQVINYTLEHPDWGQKVLDNDREIRRREPTLKAALAIVGGELDDLRQLLECRTLERLEAPPNDLDRALHKHIDEFQIASRILERLWFLGLIAYPSNVGVKLTGWMVVADKLADETLHAMKALARRLGRREPHGYGRAAEGVIVPFVHETLAYILPDARLSSPERLRHILEAIRGARVKRNEQARRDGIRI